MFASAMRRPARPGGWRRRSTRSRRRLARSGGRPAPASAADLRASPTIRCSTASRDDARRPPGAWAADRGPGELVEGFRPARRTRRGRRRARGRRAPVRPPGAPATLVPRLLRLRAARGDDVGRRGGRSPRRGSAPDLLLLEHLGDPRTRRSRLGAARQPGARFRAGGRGGHRHARARPVRGARRRGDRRLPDPERLVGPRPPARRVRGPARARPRARTSRPPSARGS